MNTGQRVKISSMAYQLPDCVVSSAEIKARVIRASGPTLKRMLGSLDPLTGVKTRRYAAPGVDASDLACAAGRRALAEAEAAPESVDLLVFASGSGDMVEPATAHITQYKLGTRAAVMDVKNACNSFINGMQVAEALILTGQYRRALVVCGELPSRSVRWKVRGFDELKDSFVGYTFGDAGAAALLELSDNETGIFYRNFIAESRYWPLCTVPGGGTAHMYDPEYSYCRTDGPALRDACLEIGPAIIQRALNATGLTVDDFACILVHQVSLPTLRELITVAGLDEAKVIVTVSDYGNMASATLPVGFCLAVERGRIQRGDRVLVIGLAAGISFGVMMFSY
jgi:3-oxoacyl-(acyl-carrier-protein) synthase III